MVNYFSKGSNGNNITFPLTQVQINNLVNSKFHSPLAGNSHGLTLPVELTTHARRTVAALEVVDVVSQVLRNEYPEEFLRKYYPEEFGGFPDDLPQPLKNERLSKFNPKGLANVVHMDHPLDAPFAVLRWLLSEGYLPNSARNNCIDFLEFIPRVSKKLMNKVDENLTKAFEVKWYFGVPRPEEVLGINMTYYPEGSPPHPSTGAGHAAAVAACTVFFDEFTLDSSAKKVILDTIYFWGMFRSLAGVHYPQDQLISYELCGVFDYV